MFENQSRHTTIFGFVLLLPYQSSFDADFSLYYLPYEFLTTRRAPQNHVIAVSPCTLS